MITLTYLLLVTTLGAGLWWSVRARRSPGPSDGRRPTRHLRAMLSGSGTDDDLVERMAEELVARTVVFGSSHAVPRHLGAELPVGVLDAATASREQLTHEVVQRYCALMDERCRRSGRPSFALPDCYGLNLALAGGPEEVLTASFEPIVDVRAAGRPGPRPAIAVEAAQATRRREHPDEVTVRRLGRTVVLEMAGAVVAQGLLGDVAPLLSVGRGAGAALRCPEDLDDVSRHHAELTWLDGRYYVADHSANGTWLVQVDGGMTQLTPGERTPWSPGDTVLLDQDRQVTVSLR